jgi:hypothetical protein
VRRLLAILALTLAVGVPSASPRSATDWKHLKYFIYESQQMFVTTDKSWEDAKVVHPPGPGLAAGDAPSPFDRRLSRDWIWAPTCQSGAQSVTMTQTFLAPGRPIPPGGAVDSTFYFALGAGRGSPFHSGVYLINGVEIARIVNPDPLKGRPAEISGKLPPRALKAFHYGENKLTIRVQKTALKKGERCNTRDRLIGALADLSLIFRPDLVAVPSPKGLEQAVRKKAGEVVGALGDIAFVNRGPSGSPGGKLVFEINSNQGLFSASSPSNITVVPPFHTCTGGGVGFSTELTCKFDDFPAGKRVELFVIVAARLDKNFPANGTTDLGLRWTISPGGGSDTNQANNYTTHRFIVCGTASTDERCKNAK